MIVDSLPRGRPQSMQASEEIKSLFVSAMLEQMLEQQNSFLDLTYVFERITFVLSTKYLRR
jgi:hypothetical protein